MQTTTTFHCRGHAAEARITPWCGKKFCNTTTCHSATAPHEWNQTFIFSTFAIFAVVATASALHPYCMYGIIHTACMESSVLHVWNHSLKVQYERVMTLQQRWQQISSTQKIQLLHVAVTWTDPCGSDMNWSMWQWHELIHVAVTWTDPCGSGVNWSMWKWHRFALLLSPHHYIAATLNKRNQAFTVFPIFAVTAATSELLLHRQCGLAD